MIKQFHGSIFDCNEWQILIHQSNCFCSFGAGIAKAIAKRYPESQTADNKTIKADYNKLGGYSYGVGQDGKIIVNMYSQFFYGRDKQHTDYMAMDKALAKIILDFESEMGFDLKCFGIPYKIGCGLGGGDWGIVMQIFSHYFKNSSLKLIICRYEK